MDVLKTYISPTRIGGPAVRKSKQHTPPSPPKPYLTWLLAFFAAWKLLLLAVAYASPGPGYDTSARILFEQYNTRPHSWLAGIVQNITLRLTRWDAIYFSTSSERGHLYEQEWAFSWFMSRLTALLSNVFPSFLHSSPIVKHALAGVLISHIFHLGAVIALYGLVRHVLPSDLDQNRQIAFTTACLHTISPAGLFLSASYGESAFAFTTFIGIHCYVRAQKSLSQQSHPSAVSWTLLSGLSIACSTLLRSNGLLNGTIFLVDALATTQHILTTRSAARIPHLLSTILAGTFLALAFALPQAVAYFEFCTPTPTRPWCTHFPPSIYTWVQKHYWHVGFLSYWTLNNAPLFLLAVPMLVVLITTGAAGLLNPRGIFSESSTISPASAHENSQLKPKEPTTTDLTAHILPRLAVPQLILSLMALTSFHVQIINRISSGYALWYIVLAAALNGLNQGSKSSGGGGVLGSVFGNRKRVEVLVRVMVMYAIVQGGLYAAFLPPA